MVSPLIFPASGYHGSSTGHEVGLTVNNLGNCTPGFLSDDQECSSLFTSTDPGSGFPEYQPDHSLELRAVPEREIFPEPRPWLALFIPLCLFPASLRCQRFVSHTNAYRYVCGRSAYPSQSDLRRKVRRSMASRKKRPLLLSKGPAPSNRRNCPVQFCREQAPFCGKIVVSRGSATR